MGRDILRQVLNDEFSRLGDGCLQGRDIALARLNLTGQAGHLLGAYRPRRTDDQMRRVAPRLTCCALETAEIGKGIRGKKLKHRELKLLLPSGLAG